MKKLKKLLFHCESDEMKWRHGFQVRKSENWFLNIHKKGYRIRDTRYVYYFMSLSRNKKDKLMWYHGKKGGREMRLSCSVVDDWSQQFFDIYLRAEEMMMLCAHTTECVLCSYRCEEGESEKCEIFSDFLPHRITTRFAFCRQWVNKWILGHQTPSREMITSHTSLTLAASCSIIKFTVEISVDIALFFSFSLRQRKSPMNFPCFES